MPIKIPDGLPAQSVLENEHIFVITENRALHQDIRPLKIGILNLMPTKIVTETQIMRSLSNTPLQFEVACPDLDLSRQKYSRRAPYNVLQNVQRYKGRQFRRLYHHGRACRADGIRGGRLLAGALRDYGMD